MWHILSIYFFPIFSCYYSLSGRRFQVPGQAIYIINRVFPYQSSMLPQVWPRSCSCSGCCSSGTGSSSLALSTRGRNCSGRCRSRKSSTAPTPSKSRDEKLRSLSKLSSKYATCCRRSRFRSFITSLPVGRAAWGS